MKKSSEAPVNRIPISILQTHYKEDLKNLNLPEEIIHILDTLIQNGECQYVEAKPGMIELLQKHLTGQIELVAKGGKTREFTIHILDHDPYPGGPSTWIYLMKKYKGERRMPLCDYR